MRPRSLEGNCLSNVGKKSCLLLGSYALAQGVGKGDKKQLPMVGSMADDIDRMMLSIYNIVYKRMSISSLLYLWLEQVVPL